MNNNNNNEAQMMEGRVWLLLLHQACVVQRVPLWLHQSPKITSLKGSDV